MPLAHVLALTRRAPWVMIRRLAVTTYLVILALSLWRDGIPLDRVGQTVWILAGLATVCIGRSWRTWVHLISSWLIFEGVLLAYDYSRGMAYNYTGPFIGGYPAEGAHNTLGMPLHVTFPIKADEFLFGGTLPTHWIQEHLHPGHTIAIVSIIVSLTYLSHFLVTPIVAIVLWIVRRDLFNTWLALALGVAIIGLTVYFLFPMSPPWLAARQGYITGPPVLTLTNEGWKTLGLKFAASLIDSGRALANPVAAMPSLHMAYATLAAGFGFVICRRRWVRGLLVCYPLVMGVSLVYGGEHYVIDEIFGVLLSVCLIVGWRMLRRWRIQRAARVEAGSALDPPGGTDVPDAGGQQAALEPVGFAGPTQPTGPTPPAGSPQPAGPPQSTGLDRAAAD